MGVMVGFCFLSGSHMSFSLSDFAGPWGLFGLNIFYSGMKYIEKDWVEGKVRLKYPLQKG